MEALLRIAAILLIFLFFAVFFALYVAAVRLTGTGRKEKAPPEFSGPDVPVPADGSREKVFFRCRGVPDPSRVRFQMSGFVDCRSLFRTFRGNRPCLSSCLGGNSCRMICPENAIVFSGGIPKILSSCTGCGLCVTVCPVRLLTFRPSSGVLRVDGKPVPPADFCPAHRVTGIELICREGTLPFSR